MDIYKNAYLVNVVLMHLCCGLLNSIHVVDECPNNLISWKKASAKLNCTDGDNAEENKNVYHCIPTINLDNMVEFCYPSGKSIIGKGLCIVLLSGTIHVKNCKDVFPVEACPRTFYYSNEIVNYPACLLINKKNKCYLADLSCSRDSNTTMNPRSDSKDISSPAIYIFIVMICIATFIVVPIIIYYVRNNVKVINSAKSPTEPGTDTPLITSTEGNQSTTGVKQMYNEESEMDVHAFKIWRLEFSTEKIMQLRVIKNYMKEVNEKVLKLGICLSRPVQNLEFSKAVVFVGEIGNPEDSIALDIRKRVDIKTSVCIRDTCMTASDPLRCWIFNLLHVDTDSDVLERMNEIRKKHDFKMTETVFCIRNPAECEVDFEEAWKASPKNVFQEMVSVFLRQMRNHVERVMSSLECSNCQDDNLLKFVKGVIFDINQGLHTPEERLQKPPLQISPDPEINHVMGKDCFIGINTNLREITLSKRKATDSDIKEIKSVFGRHYPEEEFKIIFDDIEKLFQQGEKIFQRDKSERYGTLGGCMRTTNKSSTYGVTASHIVNFGEQIFIKLENGKDSCLGKCVHNTGGEMDTNGMAVIEFTANVNPKFDFCDQDGTSIPAIIANPDLNTVIGGIVHKKGATSSWTKGVVTGIQFSKLGGNFLGNSMFVVEGFGQPFATHGDSGSLVYRYDLSPDTENVEVLGMVVGSMQSEKADNPQIICIPLKDHLILCYKKEDLRLVFNEKDNFWSHYK